MGEVYLASDLRHDRQVAIKVMRADLKARMGPDRFQREISIAGRLSHPNIVPVYDSGEAESLLYYVMPYVEGESLRDRIARETQLPVQDAVTIALAVADALSYAHDHGIVHRDIKPENIILQSSHAVVTDFGIARTILGLPGETLTSARSAIGTLAYMSPEQASATGNLDGKSDLYALALVLYEMLAGDLPFRAATPESMFARKAIGRYAPVRDGRPTVPAHIDRAIARALQPVPADRFRSVSDFADALRVSDDSAVRTRRLIRRSSLGALAGLIVVAVIGWIASERGPFARSAPITGLGRIVVAPLENRTDDPSLDIVGVMAGDWITEGLQKTGIVEVVPTTAAIQASRYLAHAPRRDGVAEPASSLAVETGAATVVSGTVYRLGDKLLFRVSIADRGGTRLLGVIPEVSTSSRDPMAGVEELRNRLMGWLAVQYDERLKSPGSGSDRPPTYEAYGAFSEGMSRYIAVENARALPLFLKAFERDTSFTVALLYASISASNLGAAPRADSLLQLVNVRRDRLSEYNRAWLDYRLGFVHGDRDAALAAIRIAAQQAPHSKASYNHALEAFYGRYPLQALAAMKAITPERGAMRGYAPYWDFYGTVFHTLGRFAEEAAIGRRSHSAYPMRLTSFRSLARARVLSGQLDSLTDLLREAEAVPTDPIGWDYGYMLNEVAEELRAHGHRQSAAIYFEKVVSWLRTREPTPGAKLRLVKALYATGRWDDASTELASLLQADSTNIDYLGISGLIHSRRGNRSEAEFAAERLALTPHPYQFGLGNLYRARIAATLGDKEAAMTRINEAFAQGRSYDLTLHRDIDLESLRGYTPFDRFLRGRD
ncbi:MAG: protein kinase [Gemmatimonadaceae bacterium]|nr:protein kinase [Gemmatimonadaceae bacterium]